MRFFRDLCFHVAIACVIALTMLVPLESACAAVVTVINDLREDEPGHTLKVDYVRLRGVVLPIRIEVAPRSSVLVTKRDISSLRITRIYDRKRLVFEVSCPVGKAEEVQLKLLDVWSNRMPGGCRLTRKGTWKPGTGTRWEDE